MDESPEDLFAQIPPEDLKYDAQDVLDEASGLANQAVNSIPDFATPAQSRVALSNVTRVYTATAQILQHMLNDKKPRLH